LHAEATFVSVQHPSAARADVATSFQRLLDARAELLETHGLDIRTDVQIGELDQWVAQLAISDDSTLIVLGLDGDATQIEAALTQRFQPLFSGRCPVLLSCSNASAASLASASGAIATTDSGVADANQY
jgi:hypothetical protein